MGICGTKGKKQSSTTPNDLNISESNIILEKKRVTIVEKLNINTVQHNKKQISQEYKIFATPLGTGAYGEVRKAKHYSSNEMRAIKIIYKQDLPEEEKNAIMKEILILKKTDHPHIVKIYEFFEDERFMYIVMELITGGELFDRIQQVHHFTEKKAAEILFDLLKGVNYLHKQSVVHRDLKPENILFTGDKILKIVDFGTSRVYDGKKAMRQTHGTPYYIAPEVLKHNYDFKCDIWSCGVIFYILLSGFPPFNGESDEEIMENVKKGKFHMKHDEFDKISSSAKDLIKKMLTYTPKNRITAEECLNHPFFEILKSSSDQPTLSKAVLTNLKNFSIKNKMQQAVFFFLINHTVTSKEKDQLSQTFKLLDTNNDGILTKEELINGFHKTNILITESELETLLASLDSNNNGQFDYSEFVGAVIDKTKLVSEDRVKRVFDYFDRDGDGSISVSEFKEVFSGNQIVEEKVWEDLVALADKDKNGKIDYEEFKSIMRDLS